MKCTLIFLFLLQPIWKKILFIFINAWWHEAWKCELKDLFSLFFFSRLFIFRRYSSAKCPKTVAFRLLSVHLSFWLWGRDCWQLGFTASWMAEKICCVFQSDLYYRSQILYFSPNLQHNYTTDSWNLMEAGGSLVVFFSSVTT